jgi:hypothetical protein
MLLYLLVVAAGNGAKPLVTRAGLQREARNGGQQAVRGRASSSLSTSNAFC